MTRVLLSLLLVLSASLFLACGGDDDDADEPDATTAPAEESPAETSEPTEVEEEEETPTEAVLNTDIDATLTDDSIILGQDTAPEGMITFHITNDGEFQHVFMIVDTDLEPDALPTTAAGAFDPVGGDAIILANTPGMNPGSESDFPYELEAGNYVIISNQLNGDEADYTNGMYAAFTVE